jgi:hypothetical protein
MLSASATSRFPQTHWVLLQHLDSTINQLRMLNAQPAAFLVTNDPVAHFNAYMFGLLAACLFWRTTENCAQCSDKSDFRSGGARTATKWARNSMAE